MLLSLKWGGSAHPTLFAMHYIICNRLFANPPIQGDPAYSEIPPRICEGLQQFRNLVVIVGSCTPVPSRTRCTEHDSQPHQFQPMTATATPVPWHKLNPCPMISRRFLVTGGRFCLCIQATRITPHLVFGDRCGHTCDGLVLVTGW